MIGKDLIDQRRLIGRKILNRYHIFIKMLRNLKQHDGGIRNWDLLQVIEMT